MLSQLQQFVNNLNKPKTYLLLGNVFLVFFLIGFSNLKMLPLDFGDLVFFSLLALALALYRPGWTFLFFTGLIPLENINLAPAELGLTIRPYQLLGAILIIAVLVRFFTGRLNFKLIRLNLTDYLVMVMTLAGLLSVAVAPDKFAAFKLAAILASFAALYFLIRNFVQNTNDLKKIIPFFLSSSTVVILYGIWQNWAYLHGHNFFEAMPGRPNATFTEPDWLGMFLVLALSASLVLIARHSEDGASRTKNLLADRTDNIFEKILHSSQARAQDDETKKKIFLSIFNYIFLIILFLLLILTVSRSAWLAAAFATLIFIFVVWTDLRFNVWRWKATFFLGLKILTSLVIAVILIYIFNLTNFQLDNRIQSAGTGLQQITVACDRKINLPAKIDTDSDLAPYSCQQIDLQAIAANRAAGKYVATVYRNDPNVATRDAIYLKSWDQIKSHPILGLGWGSISNILGADPRGVPLNSSNIFLETWLGAGLLGFLALIVILLYVLFNAVKNYFYASDSLRKNITLFIIVSWFGLFIDNLFNAGIFLGIFWLWLAIAQVNN